MNLAKKQAISGDVETERLVLQMQAFPVAELPLGTKLGCAVYDEQSSKLLSAGIPITGQLVQSLRQRRVSVVLVETSAADRLRSYRPQGSAKYAIPNRKVTIANIENECSEAIDENLDAWLVQAAVPQGEPFENQVLKPGEQTYDNDLVDLMADDHQANVRQLDTIAQAIVKGGADQALSLSDHCAQLLGQLASDSDLFTCLGINPSGSNYPGRHSLHTAMLAVAIANSMGHDENQLNNLAIGCMLHDLGMLEIDPYVLKRRKVLDPEEFVEITRHPIRIFDMLEKHIDKIPAGARMVAYQMHERFDGSGYPRRRTGATIHILARIAAVADAYVALVAPRPHRQGMLPYYAVAKILKDTSEGKYDPQVVRHFLKTVALFPLGSYVELSDNRIARVIRTGAQYDRPIVECWEKGNTLAQASLVNLSLDPEVRVVRPLPALS